MTNSHVINKSDEIKVVLYDKREFEAEIIGASFVIDLPNLGGSKQIEAMGINVRTLTSFEGD